MAEPFTSTPLARLRWPMIVGLPLLTAAMAYLLFAPQYQTNDDVGMMMIAAGAGVGAEPSPFVMFMNPLLGQLLSGLYRLWPDAAWYALFMTTVRVLAGMAFAAAVLSSKPSALRLLLLIAYFLSVDLVGHVCPQFSLAAAVAVQGAVMLWFCRDRDRPWKPAALAVFLGLVGLGVLIRADHAALIALLAVPLVIADALTRLGGRTASSRALFPVQLRGWARQTAFPMLAAAALALALVGYHRWFYHTSPGWRDFYTYNWLRGQLTDYNRDVKTASETAMRRAGWSRNDLLMVKNFFFADPEVYSAAKFRAFLRECPARPLELPSLASQLRTLSKDRLMRLLLAMALFPALFLPLRTWLGYAAVCGTAASVWLATAGMAHHYCPLHFLQAMLAFIVGVAGAVPFRAGSTRGVVWAAGASFLLVGLAQGVHQLRQRSACVAAAARVLRSQIQTLDPQPNRLYVVWGTGFPFEYILPFDSLSDLRRFKMFGLGCATNSPLTDKYLQAFGIPDLVTGLYMCPNVFLICDEAYLPLLQTYIAEHRGARVEARPLFVRPGGLFKVFQISRRAGTSSSPQGDPSCN